MHNTNNTNVMQLHPVGPCTDLVIEARARIEGEVSF